MDSGETTEVADAIIRVFIENGDRTNRNRARLKYVLDAWGIEKFVGKSFGVKPWERGAKKLPFSTKDAILGLPQISRRSYGCDGETFRRVSRRG